MTGHDVRCLRTGDSVLIHRSQFLFSRQPRRWVKAIFIEARRNTMPPNVPDVLIQIRGPEESIVVHAL